MSPEIEVLLLCGRRNLSGSETDRLKKSVRSPLDWLLVLNQSRRHGLLPLLHANLRHHGMLDLLPLDVRQTLTVAVSLSARRNLALTGELIGILRALEADGIPALPFKGPVVALAAYGDYCLRSFCDLDILVRADDLTRARDILASRGYRSGFTLSPQEESDYLQAECALQLRQEARDVIVELHWRFSERNASVSLPIEEFWGRSQRLPLAGISARTFSPEDLLLYLCVHGAKHRWARLEWSCCVAELIRANPSLDWSATLGRAKKHRVERMLNLGLWLARSLHGATLPAFLQDRLEADRGAYSLAESVRAELFSPAQPETHYQQRAKRYLFILRSRENWWDRLRIVHYSALKSPHPQAREWVSLPPRFAFLNRIFRPMRLLSQYGAVAWRYYLRRGVS